MVCLQVRVQVRFEQIYLSMPTITEDDGESKPLFPNAARLRQLTYSSQLYVDVTKVITSVGEDGEERVDTNVQRVALGKVRFVTRL